ncbi:MAG TPA: hypothetical protein VKE24_04020 [Candidatus Acidoferrales bacterium]|nr:hypothetical protein [Candidatus Acidoferrales bacterium]
MAELETSYGMLSVALNEALHLRAQGALGPVSAQVGISADLFRRLAARLGVPLRALEEHGRHFGTLPSLAPLNAEFFCGEMAQRMARKNHLLSKVLFPTRSRFLHKLRTLEEITEELEGEFREAVEGHRRRCPPGRPLARPRRPPLRREHLPARSHCLAEIVSLRPAQ